MKVAFALVDFEGNPTKAKREAMRELLESYGLVPIEATIEQPKPKAKAKIEAKPEPVAAKVEQPKVEQPTPKSEPEAKDDTRLESKESKRRGGRKFKKLPKETWPIEDCLFVGMVVASTGRECAVAGVETDAATGNIRLAFIDKDFKTASTEARWFVDPATIRDRMEANVENAEMTKTVYN